MDRIVIPDAAESTRLQLGGFVLDLARAELRSPDGQLAALRRQALQVLLVLGANAGHVVGKDELLRLVWPKVVVGEDSLAQAIAEIRRVLDDREHRQVRTVARRGYMLVPAPPAGDAATGGAAVPDPHASAAVARTGLQTWRRKWVGPALAVGAAAAALGIALAPRGAIDAVPVETVAGAVPVRSLVVLPFEPGPGATDQGWFADALTADLTSALGSWRDVLVIGRGTASRYRGKDVDPRDVARELGVRYVIRGSVRRDGDRVRLDLAMVDGQTGAQRWAEQIDVERTRLAQSIDEIRGGLARTLLVELGRSVGQQIERMRPEQAEADDLAMHGTAVFLRSLGPENFAEAGRLFEQAVAMDPNSIRGLAGVSLVNSMGVLFNWLPDRDSAVRRSEQALARLESLEANGHLTLLARAALVNLHADWEGLLTVAGTLLEHFPADATSHHHRCSALLRLGRFDDSIQSCERALRISPRDSRVAIWHGLIGMDHFMQGRYALAASHARHTVTGNPKLPFYWLLLVASLARDGRPDEARKVLADFDARHAGFDLSGVPVLWPATNPAFVTGRDLIVATVQGLRP